VYSAVAANKRNTVLMIIVFLLIIGGLGWLAGAIYQNWVITAIVVAVAAIYALIEYFAASSVAMAVSGGQRVDKKSAPELYRIVENLCITEGLPMPEIYVVQDAAPNAFATGRDPEHAKIAATTGLLEIMNEREVTAVLAHELGHVKNYDILVSMVVFGLVSAIGMICDLALRMFLWGGRDSDNKNPVLMIVGVVALILAPIIAFAVRMAVSRQREYLADATSVMTTRDPDGMISALEKLKTKAQPMQKQNTSTAHLWFANPLKKGWFSNMFSTHPPLDERIARIRDNEAKM
jgi:heat shock protein HtpX